MEVVVSRLARYLGPNTARVAVRVFSERLVAPGGALGPAELPRLLEALRPMLRTLLGRERAEELLLELAREVA